MDSFLFADPPLISTTFTGQPFVYSLTSLIGIKPVLELWRQSTNKKPFDNQVMSNQQILWATRVIETVFETIPQSAIQLIALLDTPVEDRLPLQYFSLVLSIISTGMLVAQSDRDMDLDKKNRRSNP